MILTSLSLQNFRSYPKKTFHFSPYTTLIVGPNTAGKTNILEAIVFLATGKSFRADSDREMIAWGKEIARVRTQNTELNDQQKLEIVLTTGEVQRQRVPRKKFLINGVSRRQIDFVGNLKVVLFWPEHLELVTDSPSLRRRYLDSVLVQVDREYRRNLLSYERGVRQRNSLLERIKEGFAHRGQLLFWDQLLIKSGGYITDKRQSFIDFINSYHVSHITYHVEYDKSVISESRLEQYAVEEVAAKATLVGPHRDDFVFLKTQNTPSERLGTRELNDQQRPENFLDLSKYGSRGEQRLAVLWLKLAELAFIQQEAGERPILLLDDILSELDSAHRKLIFELIGKQQTIITSAEQDIVSEKKLTDATVIQLEV